MLSELKTAFLIGFRILLPFLVVDLIVAASHHLDGNVHVATRHDFDAAQATAIRSVLVDGWHLVVEMLLQSFQTYS